MSQILDGVLTKNDNGVWYIKEVLSRNGVFHERYTPLHPDDLFENYTEHTIHLKPYEGKKVKFTVETIATGESEWDVMDKYVGKIIMWS